MQDLAGAQFYTRKLFTVNWSSGNKFEIHAWPYIRGVVQYLL